MAQDKTNSSVQREGKQEDPNNWRGICLKETSAKILSLILATRLLLNLGKIKAGVNQFSHGSCQEALHTLRLALILRCQCGLKTYALFVNLIKAFDTIDHTLLLQVLSKYGIPPKMQKNHQETLHELHSPSGNRKRKM